MTDPFSPVTGKGGKPAGSSSSEWMIVLPVPPEGEPVGNRGNSPVESRASFRRHHGSVTAFPAA
jgi:hypothetical protein